MGRWAGGQATGRGNCKRVFILDLDCVYIACWSSSVWWAIDLKASNWWKAQFCLMARSGWILRTLYVTASIAKTCISTTMDRWAAHVSVVIKTSFPLLQRQRGIKVDITSHVETRRTRCRFDKLLHHPAQSVELLVIHHSVLVSIQFREFPFHHGHSMVHDWKFHTVR